MNDVARLVMEAWEKLGPKILSDPDELARRLARRRSALLSHPPRAWCLAIRASDRRITPAHWVISPEHAMDLDHPAHPYEPIEHEVIIRPHALRKYCRPVRTDSWGEEVADVCTSLGVSRSSLRNARRAGLFTERFIRGLDGRHGRYPVPLIHSWNTLDPSSGRFFSRPDQLWGCLWEFLPDQIPDDFEQSILRRPYFRPNPRLPLSPDGEIFKNDMHFMGWRWVCPACRKQVKTIYCPFAVPSLFEHLGIDPSVCHGRFGRAPQKFLRYDVEKLDPPPTTFACWSCHRISGTGGTTNDGWNQVVSHMTTGLLFGREVEKPQWYHRHRKNRRVRRLHAKPAAKREAVFTRLMNGWTTEQIARDLLIPKPAVELHIQRMCRQERVQNRQELAIKLAWKHPQPQNGREKLLAQSKAKEDQVVSLLLQGLSHKSIARKLGLELWNVGQTLRRLYKKLGFPPRQGKRLLAQKYSLTLPRIGLDVTERSNCPTTISPSPPYAGERARVRGSPSPSGGHG